MLPDEILLINDGSFLLRMMTKRLEEKGYRTWMTNLPERALELLSTQDFDLVVLKLSEKDVDRLAILPMVKELSPEAKLVIVSDAEFLPLEVFETDFDDYISVPCSPNKLWRRLAVFLDEPTSNYQGELSLHPANYRIVQSLVANLQEIHQNLRAGEADLRVLQEKVAHQHSSDLAADLEDAHRKNSQSIFILENLLSNVTRHDFFQERVDCYDI
jgi:DNA-binding response OmpR family regulator